MPDRYKNILTKYWGYTSFRPLQEDIIRSVAEDHKDTLGLLPTGGGKSIIFQVPSMAQEGLCIVITPLIALMKDQVENLKKRGIKAISINSGMSRDEIDISLNNCIFGDYKFLYISPERIGTELFQARVVQMKVCLIAVDEAHCISQWGYDFRPSYLQIVKLKELLPGIPFLALTATATLDVVDDIQEKLKFKAKSVFRKSFERKNLVYYVMKTENKLNLLVNLIKRLKGNGLVYVRNRKQTKEIAEHLVRNKIKADYYHAGLKSETRSYKQNEWMQGGCDVMVATNAFGMGIDKADVRFVFHVDLPDSLEAYFQEAGRAGRDEKQSFAVMLYQDSDIKKLEKSIETSFPPKEEIKSIYNALGNYYQIPVGGGKGLVLDFKLADFASNYHFNVLSIYNALKILQSEGYLEVTDELNNPSRIRFIVDRQDLYKFQVSNSKFDAFIKLVLRMYTGLFSEYSIIDESFLAKQANTKREIVYDYLVKLSKSKIINYIPQKKTPLLILTEERLDEKSLFLSKDKYQDRKERYIKRINAVIKYITSTNKCRSQLLLEYFGEDSLYRCGRCDVCKKRNSLRLSKYEFDLILEQLKKEIKLKPGFEHDLINLIIFNDKEKVINVIRWLKDHKKLITNDQGKLCWNYQEKSE